MELFTIKKYGEKRSLYIFDKKICCWKTSKVNVKDYAEILGVKLGKNVRIITLFKFPYFYPFFGSEPYLIEIGDDTCISFNVTFLTHDASVHVCEKFLEKKQKLYKYGKIKIGNNCFIGCNVTILPNVNIGNNVVIGAGSVVTKDVPSGEVWAGNPAKFIRKSCELPEDVQNNEFAEKS